MLCECCADCLALFHTVSYCLILLGASARPGFGVTGHVDSLTKALVDAEAELPPRTAASFTRAPGFVLLLGFTLQHTYGSRNYEIQTSRRLPSELLDRSSA